MSVEMFFLAYAIIGMTIGLVAARMEARDVEDAAGMVVLFGLLWLPLAALLVVACTLDAINRRRRKGAA